MIGIVVVSHGLIASEMVRITRSIVRDAAPMAAVALEHDENNEEMRQLIQSAILKVDQGDGVLILSDMFGATPCNVCLSFLEKGRIEVITGINLPMLIKLSSLHDQKDIWQLASFIKDYGQKNITIAGELFKGRGIQDLQDRQ